MEGLPEEGEQWVDVYYKYADGKKKRLNPQTQPGAENSEIVEKKDEKEPLQQEQNQDEEPQGRAKRVRAVIEEEVPLETTWKEFSRLDAEKEETARQLEHVIPSISTEEKFKHLQGVGSSWDKFYAQNANKFFKDRNYLGTQFPELADKSFRATFFEMGCGAGNTLFPLLQNLPDSLFYACDFSPNAVRIVQQSLDFDRDRATVFVCDATQPDAWDVISKQSIGGGGGAGAPTPKSQLGENSVDVVLMVFFLSAVVPGVAMETVLAHAKRVLKPNGRVFFRDYGQYDLTQIRFLSKKNPLKLDTSFYMRQDGTSSYYFTEEKLEELFVKRMGFERDDIHLDVRELRNRKRKLAMHRVWIQAVFRKPAPS